MEQILIGAAILAVAFLVYKIARASQSKGGRGSGGRPGDADPK